MIRAVPPEGFQEEPVEGSWTSRLAPRKTADLDGKAIPRRSWLVPQWVPHGHITSLYGRGGGGKTTLAIALAMAASIGGDWLGMPVTRQRALGVFCEDDEDELHRRMASTADAMQKPLSDFTDFTYLARLGADENLLVAKTRSGGLAPTDFYNDLADAIRDLRAGLLLLDGIADVYGGNVNDPAEATYFLNLLLRLVRPVGGSVLLLGHPNKAGTSEFTGCGAWENKPRARLYLAPPPPKDGEEPDLNDPRRVLMRSKANYAAKDSLELTWRDGAFRVADPTLMTLNERCEHEAKKTKARDAFLAALERLDAMGMNVSHSANSTKYAPKQMRALGLVNGHSDRELKEAMNELLGEGRLLANQTVAWSPHGNKLTGLRRVV
jgi:RecA-family ATPase